MGFTPEVGLGGDLYRVEFSIHDHGLAEFARPAEAIRLFGSGVRRKLAKQAVEFFVEQAGDEFRRVFEASALIVNDAGKIAVQHALRNHQTVDAVGGEGFHVAIEQACTFTAEYYVEITDASPYRRAGSVYRALANAFGRGPQIWIAPRILGPGEKLVRVRELLDRNSILIGMPGPSSIHQTVGFIFLVLFQHRQRAGIQFGIFAAGIQRRHSADGENSAPMANLGHQLAQILKEGDI